MAGADVTRLSQRFSQLLDERAHLDTAWLALAEHFLPTRYSSIKEGRQGQNTQVLLNDKIVDATGIHAMRTLAAGLQGGMTSPARPWFRLGLDDDELANSRQVRAFLDTVAKNMRLLFHRSNFYNAIHALYSDLATFGTAFMFELGDFDSDLRFITVPAGQYAIDVSATGRVDTVYRRIGMSSRQLMQEFGVENCPEILRMALQSTRSDQLNRRWNVVHAVYPRSDSLCESPHQWHMPYASVYWLEDGARDSGGQPHVLRESGFEEFPGFGPRWDSMAGSAYGRSPAMDCLPDCKMLQQIGITTLKAIHKSVDPPMGVAASLKAVGLDLTPGGLNYVETISGQAPQAAVPLLQVRPEIQAARQLTQDVQSQIKQGLYNDLFKMLLSSERSQITAREIASREEEKLILIGPVLERLHDELFIPLIDRTFSIMARFDMLPPLPPELVGCNYRVEFVSLLAQAQKMVSTSGVDQLLAFATRTAQAFPEALDAIDVDNVVDGYAEYLGVEVDMIRPRQEREALRAQRAEVQAQGQQMAQVAQGVKVAKDVSGIVDSLQGGLKA